MNNIYQLLVLLVDIKNLHNLDYLENLDNYQLEELFVDLQEVLGTTFLEKSEILESGFSFSSSLKDICRYIIISLIENLNKDLDSIVFIISNWKRFVLALDNPLLITEEEQVLFLVFTNVYYGAIEYFKKQFISHVGEKVELTLDETLPHDVLNFVKGNGFRQRKFSYSISTVDIQFITSSTIRTFEIKQGEREMVEFLNSIYLRFLLIPQESEELLRVLVEKFPDLEAELFSIYTTALSTDITNGCSLIEISPPFEEYSYQNECMVRVYTFADGEFKVNQYSLPYNEQELNNISSNIVLGLNALQIKTIGNCIYPSNSILGQFFMTNLPNPSLVLNCIPTVVDFGGIGMLERVNHYIVPRIISIEQIIHPFIVEYVNTPSFISGVTMPVDRYKQIFLSAIATLDTNIQQENPELGELLQSGSLLHAAVNGSNLTNVIQHASAGSVSSLEIWAQGYCDNVNGVIGTPLFKDTRTSYSYQELMSMDFIGRVTSLSKKGDLPLDLVKFKDKFGNEKDVFECPICKKRGRSTFVDICASNCSECSVSLDKMRIASENRSLRIFVDEYPDSNTKEENGNGIFGILFDLFGAVFNVFGK